MVLMSGDIRKVMVTGALGQIGSELVPHLQRRFGAQNVIVSDIKEPDDGFSGSYERLDVLDFDEFRRLVRENDVDEVYHLAAILSATGELRPDLAWDVNINGFRNVLEVAREGLIEKIFHPSSIAAFGSETPGLTLPRTRFWPPGPCTGLQK